MKMRSYLSVLTVLLFVLLTASQLFSQDLSDIGPQLTEFGLSSPNNQISGSPPRLFAKNDAQNKGNEDLDANIVNDPDNDFDNDLDKELMDEYDNDSQASDSVSDPFYYFNYAMYGINDFLYFYAIKPVATGYKAITPTIVRKGVKNFFHNLLFPVRFINNLLQGKLSNAGQEVEIFLINTTAGVLGFGQVAQNYFDLHTFNEDLGQTFGAYSIGEGFYIVWPLLGPSTLRDTIGLIGDYFITPVSYVEPWELSYGLYVYDELNNASFRLGDYEALKEAAIDPYAAIKNAYIQNRDKKIKE
ncbi:MAG: VacJ family lipoprotein [Desulfobacula sp.]|nr:VacJ family lipoprotein [Desulfobacula sp.]